MLGMDMMLKTLVKAVGLEPEIFIPRMEIFLKAVWDKVQEFDQRIARMEQSQNESNEQNRALVAFIRKHHPEIFTNQESEQTDGQLERIE